jgi:hypothetical protein
MDAHEMARVSSVRQPNLYVEEGKVLGVTFGLWNKLSGYPVITFCGASYADS